MYEFIYCSLVLYEKVCKKIKIKQIFVFYFFDLKNKKLLDVV